MTAILQNLKEADWDFLLVFFLVSMGNVMFSTFKSIVTVKGGKLLSAVVNGVYYAFYNIVLIYTTADFPMTQKCVITFLCNIVGVYVVKAIDEKAEKEKLWKIEFTIPTEKAGNVDTILQNIPHSYVRLSGKHTVFHCYCATRAESEVVKSIVNEYGARWFVSESKNLF